MVETSVLKRIFGWIVLAVVGMAIFVVILIGGAVYQSLSSDDPGVLADQPSTTTWRGPYKCQPEDMTLILDLEIAAGSSSEGRAVRAIATYLEAPNTPTDEGSTSEALGTLTGNDLILLAEVPAESPPFHIASLTATLSEQGDAMLGQVQSGACAGVGLSLAD